jgi:integrase
MIYKPKGRRYYMLKFMWRGQLIRKSTRTTSAKDARSIEGKVRSELARGNWDVLEAKPAPTLAAFLRKDFLPFTRSKCAEKPATVRYYAVGARSLLSADLAGLAIDKITNQHAGQYAARHSHLSPSTVNCGLRTLRRALYLAAEWGTLNRKPKITLAKGERQRDRVLTDVEVELYLEACEQPWRDAATVMLGTGMRPGEVFSLRWENVLLKGSGGLLQIANGKSKAARRMLPLVPAVYSVLKARQNGEVSWVFPAATESGHLEGGSAKNYHARALAAIKKVAAEKRIDNPLKPFPPYTMRHTALLG